MCIVCRRECSHKTIELICCSGVNDKTFSMVLMHLTNLKILNCCYSRITYIPNTLANNLEDLWCFGSNIIELPKGMINLKQLRCQFTKISYLPNDMINLELLICDLTHIKFIPDNFSKLYYLICNKNVLVSPKIIKKILCSNILQYINKCHYITFKNCQKRYKNKIIKREIQKIIKYAYYPLYIIGKLNKIRLYKRLTS